MAINKGNRTQELLKTKCLINAPSCLLMQY